MTRLDASGKLPQGDESTRKPPVRSEDQRAASSIAEQAGRPRRIQRQRTRGWRKPPGSVCVTRGTPWGNPFVVRPDLEPGSTIGQYFAVPTLEDAIECFRLCITENPERFPALKNLRGKDLACFCALDAACHADVLLELANAPAATAKEVR